MTLTIGSPAPDFRAETTHGEIDFHQWIGSSWCVLFSHPKDFTPVCTTELGSVSKLYPEFVKRDVKVIGLSVDPVENHEKWADDIEETQGARPTYPIIGDGDLSVSKLYGMLPHDAGGSAEGRTAMDNQTVRTVFVIAPNKTIQLMMIYPMTTGRNFEEILRAIDSLQLTSAHRVATPANWKKGDEVIIVPAVSDEEASRTYPEGFRTERPYLRYVADPTK
jgi:alkyl hydroperoxide reductase subunit AhpC